MQIDLQAIADAAFAEIEALIAALTPQSSADDSTRIISRIAQEVSDPQKRASYLDAISQRCGVAVDGLRAILEMAIEGAELANHGFSFGDGFSILAGSGKKAFPVCSPLRVRGLTRDKKTRAYGVLVSVKDRDGEWRDVQIPQEELAGNGDNWIKRLSAEGAVILAAKELRHLLHIVGSEKRVTTYDQSGWHGKSYMLPDGVIGQSDGSFLFTGDDTAKKTFAQSGSLSDWQAHVATPLADNSRLILAASAAFAAPLLPVLGIEGGGFHFVGGSSCGKTTAIQVAASVFGKGSDRDGYVGTWRTTDNAMESVAHRLNHALLCVDEIGQSAKNVGETVYMIANGQGKGRSRASGGERPKLHWLTLMLSTGEMTIADKVENDKGKSTAGQAVRLVDIPADAGKGMGLFETIPDDMTPAKFADKLKRNAATFYGTASRAFIAYVAENYDGIAETGLDEVDAYARRLAPKGCDGQVIRVAQRFAHVAYAGELAIAAGIAPWDVGSAYDAAKKCFDDWLAMRGTKGSLEAHKGKEAVLKFISMHGQSRFQEVDARYPAQSDPDARLVLNRVGFREKPSLRPGNGDNGPVEVTSYYIADDLWREVCGGYAPQETAKAMAAAGLLRRQGDKLLVKKTFPGMGERYYRCVELIRPVSGVITDAEDGTVVSYH